MSLNKFIKGFCVVMGILLCMLYPFIVYYSLQKGMLSFIYLIVFGYFLNQIYQNYKVNNWQKLWVNVITLILIGGLASLSMVVTVQLLPIIFNSIGLVYFAMTLVDGPPLIERFARIQIPDLPEEVVAYCKNVTIVWILFFALQMSINAGIIIHGDQKLWVLYNGFLSYFTIAFLVILEYLYRRVKFRHLALTSFKDTVKTIITKRGLINQ